MSQNQLLYSNITTEKKNLYPRVFSLQNYKKLQT